MILAEGGTLERRCDRAERVGEDVYPSFGGVELSDVKIKQREQRGLDLRWLPVDGGTQQPIES